MFIKRILVPDRVRRLPRSDWSWLERRFVREFSSKLSGDAVFLYFMLTAVSDQHGLSYYSDTSLALRLRTSERSIVAARDELISCDLIAYNSPLAQVLSLPAAATERGGQAHLRELFRGLDDSPSTSDDLQ